jgi:ATP-dependent RNA helicase DeaD
MSLKDFLKEQLNLDRDGVAKVDVKNTFSFFNVATDDVEKVQSTFDTFMLKGRHVNVEITKDQKSGGGRKGGDRSRDRGDRKPRKRFDKNKSSDFKGKRSGGSSVKSSFERRRKKS